MCVRLIIFKDEKIKAISRERERVPVEFVVFANNTAINRLGPLVWATA